MESKYSWLVLLTVTITNVITIGFIFGSIGVFVQFYSEHFPEESTQTGWIGSAAAAVLLIFSPVSVMIVRHLGLQRTVTISVMTAVVGVVLTGYASKVWHVVLSLSVLTSASLCNLHISGISAIPKYFDEDIYLAFTIQGAGSAFGTLMFPFVIQTLLKLFEYKDVMIILGGVLSLNILGALVYKSIDEDKNTEDAAGKTETSSWESFKSVTRPVLIIYFLNTIIWNGGKILIRVFLYSYITHVYDNRLLAGTAMTLFGVGQLVLSVLKSIITARINTNKYLIHLICLISMACSALAMGLVNNVHIILALACFHGGMFGVILSNIPNLVKHLNGTRSHSMVYAISQTCGGVGSLMAPPIASKFLLVLPENSLFFFSAGLTALSFLLMLLMLIFKRTLWHPYENTNVQTVQREKKTTEEVRNSDTTTESVT